MFAYKCISEQETLILFTFNTPHIVMETYSKIKFQLGLVLFFSPSIELFRAGQSALGLFNRVAQLVGHQLHGQVEELV